MDIKSFGNAGTLFYLQGIQLRTIADKIVVLIDEGCLPVYTAKAISPYIQKKGNLTFNIRAERFPDLRVNDNAGKPFCIQQKVTPSQPVAKSLGNLAFQPGKIWKFMEDHQNKIQQSFISVSFIGQRKSAVLEESNN